jgi:hypothetical protein
MDEYKNLIIILSTLLAIVLPGCGNDNPTDGEEPAYVTLQYTDFMMQPVDSVAAQLAQALDVAPVRGGHFGGRCNSHLTSWDRQYVVEQFECTTSTGGTICVCLDSVGDPIYASYYLRFIIYASPQFNITLDESDSISELILGQLGIECDESVEYHSRDHQGSIGGNRFRFYETSVWQKYKGISLDQPSFRMFLDGDDGEVLSLKIPRWSTNLADITQTLPESQLWNCALNHYAGHEYVVGVSDAMNIYGYVIAKDALCVNIGYACLYTCDSMGCRLGLYVDMQNGNVVDEIDHCWGKK